MAHFLIPSGAAPLPYDVDGKAAPGSVWRMSVPLGGSAEIGLFGGAGLLVRSNNTGTVPSSFAERSSGNIRILKLQGSAVGTAMIEAGPPGQQPWIVLQ